MATPELALVMPFRNAAPWLASTLVALRHDSQVPVELVAIDDGSSDGGAELLLQLCRHWPAGSWRLLDGGGRGVSAARNQGVAASSAPLIAFVDADDRPLPGRLALPLEALQQHPGLDHVHGGWLRCPTDGAAPQAVRPWLEGAAFDWTSVIEYKAVLPSAWTLRRSAFERVGGFDEGLSHAEDVDLLARLAASGSQGAWIPELLVRYRVHPASASARLEEHLQGLMEVLERQLQGLEPALAPWAAEQRYGTLTWGCWQAWQADQLQLALALLQQALPACPYPLPRRRVHLLEVFARSSRRVGAPWDRQALQTSPFWKAACGLIEHG